MGREGAVEPDGAQGASPGGSWAAERFGVRLIDAPASDQGSLAQGGSAQGGLAQLAGVALRRNPKRAQLIVSTVLGKHVPASPGAVLGAGRRLGALVAAALGPEPVLVVGFAETATALGQAVAEVLDAPYVASTRRPTGSRTAVAFEESHSHATGHRLAPDDPGLLAEGETVVLVDDELSTGATAMRVIRRLEAVRPGRRYVLAALVDLRGEPAQQEPADGPGPAVRTIALAAGRLDAPDDLLERTAALRIAPEAPASPSGQGRVVRLQDAWPEGARAGAARGFTRDRAAAFDAAVDRAAAAVADVVEGGAVHLLGTEELMFAPQRIAERVAALRPEVVVTTSSTTRSPVVVIDEPGYPIRSAIRFAAHDDPDDGPGPRYAYNLPAGGTVVVVVDRAADTAALLADGGLVPALTGLAGLVAVLPVLEDDA